jgi:DNA-binding CsgD family transcriptional regulator
MSNHLPGGLMDNNGEFFVCSPGNVHLLTGGAVLPFEEFPAEVLLVIEKELLAKPKRHVAITEMVADTGRVAELKQLTHCLYGGFDKRADLLNGKLTAPEFWNCTQRGKCKYEGVVCNGYQLENGSFLSRRELEIIQLTAMGFLDKQIAGKLGISPYTVAAHQDNVRVKLSLPSKVAVTAFAYERNLVWT